MIPILDFDGFISLQVGLLEKLSLWFLTVINESFVASPSTRLSMARRSAIFFSSSFCLLRSTFVLHSFHMILHLNLLTLAYFATLLLSTLRINMEPVNLGYSTKNIPIAQPKEYLKYLVEKTESFLRRVRWKAYHS